MAEIETAPGYDLALDANYTGLFETPVVIARMKNAGALIADLKSVIQSRMEASPGLDRSNIGGWHSDAGMPQWGGPAARALAQEAINMAQRITHLQDHSWQDVSWAVQMWANVSGPGAQNMMHVHPGNLWAAVFYVELGLGASSPDEVGGELYFEDPRFPGAAMHGTAFRPRGRDGSPHEWQKDMRPQPGDMVLFPAWLRHGVRPYRGEGQRISIAMNLDPTLNNPQLR